MLYYDTKGNIACCAHYGKQSTLFGFEVRWLRAIIMINSNPLMFLVCIFHAMDGVDVIYLMYIHL